jgi:transposase-like protein
MWIMIWRTRHSREVRERAVALVFEQVGQYSSQWEAICSVASKVNVSNETLRKWVRLSQAGLLEPLLRLAGLGDGGKADVEVTTIDDLDTDSLVRLALDALH